MPQEYVKIYHGLVLSCDCHKLYVKAPSILGLSLDLSCILLLHVHVRVVVRVCALTFTFTNNTLMYFSGH